MPSFSDGNLHDTLSALRRRLLAVGLLAVAGYGLVAALLFWIAWMWLDLALELTPGLRVSTSTGAALLAVAVFLWGLVWNLRQGTALSVARRLDQVGGTCGEILSGADLSATFTPGAAGSSAAAVTALSPGLAALAVERAAALAAGVARPLAAPVRPIYAPAMCLAGIVLTGAIVALAAPRLAATQWLRFTDPFGDHPPYSRLVFSVQPGDANVVYGEGLEVRATATGGVPERLELVLISDGRREEALPMFPEPSGAWRASIASVTARQRYFVRDGRARSRRYGIEVLSVPRFQEVTFQVTPPDYTRQSAYEGPLPPGGLAGLPRTTVTVRVKSNRPLKGGRVEGSGFRVKGSEERARLEDRGGEEKRGEGGHDLRAAGLSPGGAAGPSNDHSQPPAGARAELRPGADPHEASATFEIIAGGKAAVTLVDVEGLRSSEPFNFPITLLRDERPFIRILEPPAESLAAPDAAIPLGLSAEDDYGVSRVQLFRSLNGSRALPLEVPVTSPPPGRWTGTSVIDLGACGVRPGDVIKLFARVEDNDPDGAKGSESTLAVVRVIAQDDYERLMRTRDGMEVLASRYQQANRRLESLLDEMAKLGEELAKSPPDDRLSDAQRERFEDLAGRMEQAAGDIAKAAGKPLPYDLDRKLSPQLEELARKLQEAAKETRKTGQSLNMGVGMAGRKLKELAEKLGQGKGGLQKDAIAPLEHLAAIYPLMEDQAVFLALFARQRDLAGRLSSLKGKDTGDDPAVRARMRELEEEQRQLREALGDLLDGVEEHVALLPEDERLDDLRRTALDFAKGVRASPAVETMALAESALAEFNGTSAHQAAQEAVEILEAFLGQCNGMGSGASACLKFNPTLSSCLGDSVEQLLNDAGLSAGMNPGGGVGGGSGYSMQRNSLANVGLYGNLPTLGRPTESGRGGRDARTVSRQNRGGRAQPYESPAGGPAETGQAFGTTNVDVPLQYRRKVGAYFERIAEETGETVKGRSTGMTGGK